MIQLMPAVGSGNLKRLGKVSLGSAATRLTMSGLTINQGNYGIFIIRAKDAIATGQNVALEINGDTTATNYYTEYVNTAGATTTSGRSNSNDISSFAANGDVAAWGFWMCAGSGFVTFYAVHGYGGPTSSVISSYSRMVAKTATVASITSISIAGAANGLAANTSLEVLQFQ